MAVAALRTTREYRRVGGRWRALVAVFTLATAIACATGGPVKPATPPLSTEVDASMAAVSAFVWSMTHRLAWSDFRGPVPPAGSDEGAETVYSLFYGVRCTGKVLRVDKVAQE